MPGRYVYGLAVAVAGVVITPMTSAGAASPQAPVVSHIGQIDRQDIAPQPGSEPDTLVEPDVAVSPLDPQIAVAAAHDGRFPDGGAVDISYAWTHNGGRTWQHAPLPGVSAAAGGVWDRVSDPVLAFGPDGSVYLSVLDFNLGCESGVSVSRSTDGGETFAAPVQVDDSADCNYSDDKNTLVVDNGRHSPHRGRIYQFWSVFLYDSAGNNTGSPQVLRWSDDHGQTWSATVSVTPDTTFGQDSQAMLQPDGMLIDAYLDYGHANAGESPESRVGREQAARPATPAVAPPADTIAARTSADGGATWSSASMVTTQAGEGPPGIRCCLPSATADAVTGKLYMTWISPDSSAVELSRSSDGKHWSSPRPVTRPAAGRDYINVDVAAYNGQVFVTSSTRDTTVQGGRYAQQQLSTSNNDGRYFTMPLALGPRSDLNYAANAGGIFPGDYMGTAATRDHVYAVWCRSSRPPDPSALYHQTLWAASLQTA